MEVGCQLEELINLLLQFFFREKWFALLRHLLEVIKDVPIEFPAIDKLQAAQLAIYRQIVERSIKPGAGIVMATLSEMDYSTLTNSHIGKVWSLVIRSEDTTTLVIPLTPYR